MDKFKEWVMVLQPRYAVEVAAPFEPDPTYLLGNRWADYGLACLVAFAFPIIRGLLRTNIYEPLGRKVIFGASSKQRLTGKQEDRLKKWNESAWKMTIFSFMSGMAFWVSVGEPWFLETRYFWLGCNKFPPCNLSVSKGVLLFYAVETGFYAQSIHFLLFHETRRKDWLESMVHHVATLGLLVYSYYVNFTRVGVMIMLVHDVSDIFLEAAKLARYARIKTLAEVVFAMFAVIWLVTRNFIFPFVLIRSTLTEPLHYAAIHKISPEPHYTIFNSLLVLLEVLHIYWTYLIFRIVYVQLTQGEAKDIREEDEDDD